MAAASTGGPGDGAGGVPGRPGGPPAGAAGGATGPGSQPRPPAGPRPRGRGPLNRRRPGLALVLPGVLAAAATAVLVVAAAGGWRPGHAGRPAGSGHPSTGAPRTGHKGTQPARPTPPPRPAIGRRGAYQVGTTSMLITSQPRRRPALPTLVRYPLLTASAPRPGPGQAGWFPLVVFAPGFRQCTASYSGLLRAWASAGYVVAAVQFPATSCRAAVPDEADVANQPADIRHVISALLAASARPAGVLSGLINRTAIAVAGHSDGGDDAAAVAADTCCRDRRIKAAVILAGAEWPPLAGRYFPAGSPPALFVQGSADTWNPPAASIQLYEADRAGVRYYLDLLGADHFTPYQGGGASAPVVARVTLDFLNRYLAGERGAVTAMATAADVPGVAELVSGGRLPR